jgi:CheY-like chemotaxis protein
MKALVVCSNEAILRVLRQILSESGVALEASRSMEAALSQWRKHSYELILLDWDMADVASAPLPEWRRTSVNPAGIMVVIMDGRESAQPAFAKGVNFVLFKPLSADQVRHSLQAALRLRIGERRSNPRHPLHVYTTVSYPAQEAAPVTLMNVSGKGTALQTPHDLPPNSKLYFQFQLPGRTETIRLTGHLVWQDSAGRAGIRFADVPKASRRYLDEWLTGRGQGTVEVTVQSEKPTQMTAAERTVPGHPPPNLKTAPGNRRNRGRVECRVGARVRRVTAAAEPYWCSLTCFIEMTAPFPAGTAVEIEVRTETTKLITKGVVKNANPGFGMGVSFRIESTDQKRQVEELVRFLNPEDANQRVSTVTGF